MGIRQSTFFEHLSYFILMNVTSILVLAVLPLSFFYDLFETARIRWTAMRRDNTHEERVKDIQAQIKRWREETGGKVPMCTARPSWKTISLQKMEYKNKMCGIRIDLKDILAIDADRMSVTVEPGVTIGQLNEFLIAKGFTLPVVPELDDLTIGGLIIAGGIETTSHRFGYFHRMATRYEVILADASVVQCTKTENSDLFAALCVSYGTFGFLTAVDLNIVKYHPYVKVTYEPQFSMAATVQAFESACDDPEADSVEGIVFSRDRSVIMKGQFVDRCDPSKCNRIGRWYKPWFYTQVEKVLGGRGCRVEYIPTRDFFHRHNRSVFWLLGSALSFGNTVVFRYLFGWLLPIKFSFFMYILKNVMPHKAFDRGFGQMVIQDYVYPISSLESALSMIHVETAGLYPLWLCPANAKVDPDVNNDDELIRLKVQDKIFVDIGVYGRGTLDKDARLAAQRRMEEHSLEHGAFAGLYAETLYTREQFEELFNIEAYERVRKKYGCSGAFPHVYDKISCEGRNPK